MRRSYQKVHLLSLAEVSNLFEAFLFMRRWKKTLQSPLAKTFGLERGCSCNTVWS